MTKRDRPQIIRAILELAMGESVPITTIMQRVGMTNRQTKVYLMYMIEKDLLRYEVNRPGRPFYRTTPKGVKFMTLLDSIEESLDLSMQYSKIHR